VNEKDKLRKLWLTPEERRLLKAIEQKRPKHRARSKTFKIAKKRESLRKRILLAIRDRPVSFDDEVLLLDGKPLKDCTPEVRKAFLIQEQIRHFYIWEGDTILSDTGSVYDLPYPDHICPKCFRYIAKAKVCPYCGAKIEGES